MASGRPDWHSIVTISGKYGDQFVPVLVDSNGQMYIALTGQSIGVTNLPSDYFKANENVGNVANIPSDYAKGTDIPSDYFKANENVGNVGNMPADYFKANENVGNVGNMPSDYYKKDEDIGRIKGDESGTPHYIAVDTTGVMLARLKGAFGAILKDIAVDTTGILLSRMKGAFGGVLKDIAVDTSGKMISLMQGDFGGSLKNIAVDTNGIMKANLVVQDLARLIMRVSQGPIIEGDLGHVFGGIGSADILDVSGAGTILGGFLMHTTGTSHRQCSVRMSIDGVDFTTRKFETMMEYNTTDLYSLPTRIIHYDDDGFRYIVGFVYGWSFDTGFKVRFSEATGASTTVGAIYYSLIT